MCREMGSTWKHQTPPCSCHRIGYTPSRLFEPATARKPGLSSLQHPEEAQNHISRAAACTEAPAHTQSDSSSPDSNAAIHTSQAHGGLAPLGETGMNLADTLPFQYQSTSTAQRGNVGQQHAPSCGKTLPMCPRLTTLGSGA